MANKISDDDLLSYIEEHLKYERDMLAFTYDMLSKTGGKRWCVMFESFGVHARNLYDFLRHEGKNNTVRADDYVPGRSRPAASNVDAKMNSSFFHLSTSRLANKPITLADAIAIGGWIDKEWTIWANQLRDPFRQLVDASPICPPLGPSTAVHSATNHSTSTSTIIHIGRKS